MPESADDPVVARFSTDEFPICASAPPATCLQAISTSLIYRVAPILSNVPGVGSIALIGAQQREVQVTLDNDKLKAYGIMCYAKSHKQ